MHTKSQGPKFLTTEQDLYSPKGSLDILPYHIRMQIYRMHIRTTKDTSLLAIAQTCRGIYAEIYQEIREKMIDRVFSPKTLVIVSGQNMFDKNLRVLKFEGVRYGLTLTDTRGRYIANATDIKADSNILGALTSLEIKVQLHNSLYWKPFGNSMTQMLEQLSSELGQLTELRMCNAYDLGYRRLGDYHAEIESQNLCTVLGTFLLIPTVRQVRLRGGWIFFEENRQSLFAVLHQLRIKYEVVSESEFRHQVESIIKLYK